MCRFSNKHHDGFVATFNICFVSSLVLESMLVLQLLIPLTRSIHVIVLIAVLFVMVGGCGIIVT